jgi:uncharacterized protein (DUF362 family)
VDNKVWDQAQIYCAAELGLGQADPARIKIEDVRVLNFDRIRGAWREESQEKSYMKDDPDQMLKNAAEESRHLNEAPSFWERFLKSLKGKAPDFIVSLVRKSTEFGPPPSPPTRRYPEMSPATVALARAEKSIEQAVREAVEAAGGLNEIEKGHRVIIKPNMVIPSNGGLKTGRVTTHPEVVRAVIRLVKERGAYAIVGDRATFSDETALVECGYLRVCKEEGAEAFPWIRDEYVPFSPGKRHWSKGFRYPKAVAEADHFINVPMLKNHEVTAAEFSCCLKAYVGLCHPEDRWQKGPDALHAQNIGEKIAELNLCKKPTINIVDATTIMINGGPGGLSRNSMWADSDLILASKDRVACDSVALAVLKHYGAGKKVDKPYVAKSVWDNVQIYSAAEIGIGQADPAHITIEAVKVPNLDRILGAWR